MVSLSAFHAVTVELHGGMLALAAICLLVLVIGAVFRRTLGKRAKRLASLMQKAVEYAEPTAYVAAIGGIVGLILSSVSGYFIASGMYSSASEALVNTPIMMNKITLTIIALELWVLFVAIRGWYGRDLWNVRSLGATYVLMGLAAFTFTMVAGSMGGHMTGKGSILDPIIDTVGIDYSTPWVMDLTIAFTVLLAFTVVAAISIIYVIYHSRFVQKAPVENEELYRL